MYSAEPWPALLIHNPFSTLDPEAHVALRYGRLVIGLPLPQSFVMPFLTAPTPCSKLRSLLASEAITGLVPRHG